MQHPHMMQRQVTKRRRRRYKWILANGAKGDQDTASAFSPSSSSSCSCRPNGGQGQIVWILGNNACRYKMKRQIGQFEIEETPAYRLDRHETSKEEEEEEASVASKRKAKTKSGHFISWCADNTLMFSICRTNGREESVKRERKGRFDLEGKRVRERERERS